MSNKIRVFQENPKEYVFQCPGCNQEHKINDGWQFNQDFENPTISPSVLVQGYMRNEDNPHFPFKCHSFIKSGAIQFLNDCTHNLAGQTVDLPIYKDEK